MKYVIMAGGGGTRLWPVSREKLPKQICAFLDNETLLQKTYKRLRKIVPLEDIFIAGSAKYKKEISTQLKEIPLKNFAWESCRRDTAPAIGLAAAILSVNSPDDYLTLVPSDHYIRNEKEYLRLFQQFEKILKKFSDHTFCLGIKPTYPETGYGYIHFGKAVDQIAKDKVYHVEEFVEKPGLETAKKYVESGKFYWNAGIFSWKISHLLNLFKEFLPETYKHLMIIKEAFGKENFQKILEEHYQCIEPISIDYGIIEKTKNIIGTIGDFGWSDIGHWKAVKEILTADENKDFVKGRHVSIDSSGNLIFADRRELVATVGLKNTIVIDTDDVLLVCPIERAQEVKKIVEALKKNGQNKYL